MTTNFLKKNRTLFAKSSKKGIPVFGSAGGEHGFTILEVMVSMSIFIILITIGLTAVLDAMRQHYAAQNSRTVMDNLNFVMEDMSRNIRVGTFIRCADSQPNVDSTTGDPIPFDCLPLSNQPHNVLFFKNLNGQLTEYIISDTQHTIKKSVNGADPQVITPPGTVIDFQRSGFDVRGAPENDGLQPTVTIRLSGSITYKNSVSKFSIETTVALRQLDS